MCSPLIGFVTSLRTPAVFRTVHCGVLTALSCRLASHGGQPTVSTQLTTKGGGGGPGFDERKTFSSLRDEGLGVRDDGKVWLVSLGVHQPGISASAVIDTVWGGGLYRGYSEEM